MPVIVDATLANGSIDGSRIRARWPRGTRGALTIRHIILADWNVCLARRNHVVGAIDTRAPVTAICVGGFHLICCHGAVLCDCGPACIHAVARVDGGGAAVAAFHDTRLFVDTLVVVARVYGWVQVNGEGEDVECKNQRNNPLDDSTAVGMVRKCQAHKHDGQENFD